MKRKKKNQAKIIERKSPFEKRKNETSGITLIALVITIIVLLILAGVSIATLTGDNGILTKAQTAKERNDVAEKEETQKLLQAEANMNFEEIEYNGVIIPAGMAPTRKEGESTVAEGLVAVDKNGNEWVWIEVPKSEMPADLTFANETGYSEEDQANCDSITAALKTYAYPYTKGKATQNCIWTDEWYADSGEDSEDGEDIIITENTAETNQKELKTGCGLTLNEYKETYQKMIKSVYKNGGFWIGRYEAGIEGTTGTDKESLKLGRISSSARIDISTSPKAISQKDAIPYNFVTCSEAQKLAKEMTPDSSKTSSLLFGIQWDLVCKYLEVKSDLNETDINTDSQKWGNYYNVEIPITSSNAKSAYVYYNNSDGNNYFSNEWTKMTEATKQAITDVKAENRILLSTGASEKTKILNIYDLAGNEWEWTLEHATAYANRPCSSRGGFFDIDSSDYPASYRGGNSTPRASNYNSFRSALY